MLHYETSSLNCKSESMVMEEALAHLTAFVSRALVGRHDHGLVGGRDVDARCLAVHVGFVTCCDARCNRRSCGGSRVGARGSGAGGVIALSSGKAQEGDNGNEDVHVVIVSGLYSLSECVEGCSSKVRIDEKVTKDRGRNTKRRKG